MTQTSTRLSIIAIQVCLLLGCQGTSDQESEGGGAASLSSSEPQWVFRNIPAADVAVVFIHGIFGDSIETWTHESGTTFFELVADHPNLGGNVDIFAFGYTSSMFGGKSSFTIGEAANRLHERLKYHGVLDYSGVVFVAHSMGGLVTLQELTTRRDILPRVPLIVFYGTPQEGAQITRIATHILSNAALEEMLPADKNSYLQQLNDDWKEATRNSGPPIICGYEKRPTKGVVIVPWESATRFCHGAASAIDADHSNIVKPATENSDAVVILINALNEYAVGQSLAPKLELPDFVREGDDWTFTLDSPFGQQTARLVNSGRLPLRYTIAELSDNDLAYWPYDTPRSIDGQSTQIMRFGLMNGVDKDEFRFKLRADPGGEKSIVVRVQDLDAIRQEQAELVSKIGSDLNTWLAQDNVIARLENEAPGDPTVARTFVSQVYKTVDEELPDTPEGMQWFFASEALRVANWHALAIEALRSAEDADPDIVRNPSVNYIAEINAAATGETRVFDSVYNPIVRQEYQQVSRFDLTDDWEAGTATGLAIRMQEVPALRAEGLSLQGDIQSSGGDVEAARRAYEEAAQIRMTPSLSDRITGLPTSGTTNRPPFTEHETRPSRRAATSRDKK